MRLVAKGWTAERLAQVALIVQMLVLIRLPIEFFRIKHVLGNLMPGPAVDPLLVGQLLTAVCSLAALGFYFAGRFRTTAYIGIGNVIFLLAYKIMLITRP